MARFIVKQPKDLMWAARDLDGTLWLFDKKPRKTTHCFLDFNINTNRYYISSNLFPEITFRNSPVKVRLNLEILEDEE